MSSRVKRSRRSQSEVIAAMILIPLLIVIFSTVMTNTFKTNVVGTSSLASRTRFEQERSSEDLRAVWVGDAGIGHCEIQNTGAIDITIVRYWKSGSFTNTNFIIKKGDAVSTIEDLDVRDIELAVTSRGNTFPLSMMCEQSRSLVSTTYSTGSLFTSENILNSSRLIGSNYQDKKIITTVNNQPYAVIYCPYVTGYCRGGSDAWYYNNGNGWIKGKPASTSLYPDVDSNNINEVIVVDPTTIQPVKFGNSINNVSITFVDLLRVRYPDTINVFFKVIANLSIQGRALQVVAASEARISNSTAVAVASGSTAVGAYSIKNKGREESSEGLFFITGYISFPVNAFESYRKAITNGNYSLTLSLIISCPTESTILQDLRVEYIAVTGAELRWLP